MKNDSFSEEILKSNLKKMEFAIFDFDGTIYPNLCLFDVSQKIFSDRHSESAKTKLKKLEDIAKIYKNGQFEVAYSDFLKLLKGESKEEFQQTAKKMMENCYKYAKLSIEKLNDKYKIESHLISLTSDFISDVAKEHFNFQQTISIPYLTEEKNGEIIFTGETNVKIESPQTMKENMLQKLKAQHSGKFICFCDSFDDIPIIKNASLKLGINPKQTLLQQVEFDLILKSEKGDPWQKFYEII